MCGIIGYKGSQNAIPVLIDGLKALEYRGYDSAGIAYLKDEKINIIKEIGKVKNLENSIDTNISANIGIAHTRWATHGGVTKENAHPHQKGDITLVHNGIFENYEELKQELIANGYDFYSATDTEVLCTLIDSLYQKEKDMLKALSKLKDIVKGSYALAIMNEKEPDNLYAIRVNSPLIVAKKGTDVFLASDVPAILKYTNIYYLLDNNDIVKIDDKVTFYDGALKEITKKEHVYEGSILDASKNGYEHFMLKEINEEPKVIRDIYNFYVTDGKLNSNMPEFKKYQKIIIVGCGSACYTGDIYKHLYEKYLDIPVEVYLASEYRYQKIFYDKNTLVIFISQSGETADTLEALNKTKNDGIDTLAIVNTYASSIARIADQTLYIKAGSEIAVATTKAFSAQLCLLALVLIKMSDKEDLLKYIPEVIEELENTLKKDFSKYAKKIYDKNNAFYIGRGIDFGLCEEGSLKLKEISYINSSAFPAGELKHGTISLIEENTPVMSIITDENLMLKTLSNVKEVRARGAYTMLFTNKEVEENASDEIIYIKDIHEIFNPILMVMPLQLISYYVALNKGEDIDKPRNLAKSVTVE